jgi:hypothetical protein
LLLRVFNLKQAASQYCSSRARSTLKFTRAEQRQMMIELVDDLVPVLVEEMIEQGVLPAEWRETKLQ